MKYVFYDYYCRSGLPRYTDEIAVRMKALLGTEMQDYYFKSLCKELQQIVDRTNEEKRCKMILRAKKDVDRYLGVKNGWIYIYKNPEEESAAIRLHFIGVDRIVVESISGEMAQYSLEAWESIKDINEKGEQP